MTYGENFKALRKEKNLTQKQVADKLGVYQSSISDWENDVSQPDFDKLKELAKLYDATLYELLMDEDPFFWS